MQGDGDAGVFGDGEGINELVARTGQLDGADVDERGEDLADVVDVDGEFVRDAGQRGGFGTAGRGGRQARDELLDARPAERVRRRRPGRRYGQRPARGEAGRG